MTKVFRTNRLAPLGLGLVAGLGQVVLTRELLALSGGLELAVALGLGSWLAWSAAGSWAVGRWLGRRTGVAPLWPLGLAGAGGLVSLGLMRIMPLLADMPLGAVPSLGHSALLCLVSLAPAAFLAGAGFPLVLAGTTGRHPAVVLGRVYGLEALGAMAGGALFALVLVRWLVPVQVLALGALCAAAVAGAKGPRATVPWAVVLLVLLAAGSWLERVTTGWAWQGRRPAVVRESPYARLSVLAGGGQRDFYAGGLWLFSLPDPERAQRTGLLPLLAHPRPRRVLFIGGGANGAAAAAAARGDLELVQAVELDPLLVALAQPAAPGGRLEILPGDGRQELTRRRGYDLVVVDLPPPVTVQLNRYYSAEGMAAMARALNPGGVLVLALPGMENLVGPMQARRLAAVLAAAPAKLGQPVFFFGPRLRLLFTKGRAGERRAAVWLRRLRARGWDRLVGVRPDMLTTGLDPRRAAMLRVMLGRLGPQPANRDLRPSALLWDPALWGGRLGGLSAAAGWLAGVRLGHLAWPLAALALVVLLLTGRGRCPGLAPRLGLVATGLTSMALSVLVIMAYQVLFGALYLGLALLMAGFMAGLATASLVVSRRLSAVTRPWRALTLTSALMVIACQGTWGLLLLLHQAQASSAWAWLWVLAAAVDGGITGAFFCLAGRLGLAGGRSPLARRGGGLYGLELAGGVAGALLPVVLAPTVGIDAALLLLALLNLLPLAGFIGSGRAGRFGV